MGSQYQLEVAFRATLNVATTRPAGSERALLPAAHFSRPRLQTRLPPIRHRPPRSTTDQRPRCPEVAVGAGDSARGAGTGRPRLTPAPRRRFGDECGHVASEDGGDGVGVHSQAPRVEIDVSRYDVITCAVRGERPSQRRSGSTAHKGDRAGVVELEAELTTLAGPCSRLQVTSPWSGCEAHDHAVRSALERRTCRHSVLPFGAASARTCQYATRSPTGTSYS